MREEKSQETSLTQKLDGLNDEYYKRFYKLDENRDALAPVIKYMEEALSKQYMRDYELLMGEYGIETDKQIEELKIRRDKALGKITLQYEKQAAATARAKDKLDKEGLFDKENKIPLPRFINSIGVVTSSTGAVLQDIKNVTSRRNTNLDIYVYDAQVQGNYAVQQLIEGITYFDNYSDVDVVIVARGGGSIEDLSPFNSEELARVAFICNKPLISAVGHETDFSILDFVADLRAPTPSAAAELVTYDIQELKSYINNLNYTISSNVENVYNELNNKLKTTTLNIENQINDIVNDNKLSVVNYYNQIKSLTENIYQTSTHAVDKMINILDKLSPLRILKSGYSYVLNSDNKPITDENTKAGDVVDIITENVKYNAKIIQKEKFNVREKH